MPVINVVITLLKHASSPFTHNLNVHVSGKLEGNLQFQEKDHIIRVIQEPSVIAIINNPVKITGHLNIKKDDSRVVLITQGFKKIGISFSRQYTTPMLEITIKKRNKDPAAAISLKPISGSLNHFNSCNPRLGGVPGPRRIAISTTEKE